MLGYWLVWSMQVVCRQPQLLLVHEGSGPVTSKDTVWVWSSLTLTLTAPFLDGPWALECDGDVSFVTEHTGIFKSWSSGWSHDFSVYQDLTYVIASQLSPSNDEVSTCLLQTSPGVASRFSDSNSVVLLITTLPCNSCLQNSSSLKWRKKIPHIWYLNAYSKTWVRLFFFF